MDLIGEFIARYTRELDYYEQAARLVAQQIDQQIQTSGIRAMVTPRAKNPERLKEKVQKRAKDGRYTTVEDIYADIVDLAGARVSLYFPGQRTEVDKIVRALFVLLGAPKEFPKASGYPAYEKRFSGYGATHYHVRLRKDSLPDAQKRYADARVEVQVASVLMLAWAEVEHDLVYKPTQGELSEDEYAILDELNGLVLAGEIALERLQRAGDVRVSRRGSQFSNHYDLSSYLLDATRPMLSGPVSDSAVGRVDELFELLRRAGSATPEALEPYLELLHADTERRPISEQIADQILAENPALYRTFAEIRAGRKTTTEHHENIPSFEQDSNYMQALGHFLARWITFERFSNELASILQPDARKPKFPTTRWLAQLGVLDEEALSEIEFVRRLRNNLVHGVERPDAPYLTEAANRLEALFEEFARSPNEAVQTAIERARLE